MIYNDDGTLKYDMTENKILRIDLQNVFNDRLFANKEDLREQLISFHSFDWSGEGDINELTLEDLCNYGDWDYKEIEEVEK